MHRPSVREQQQQRPSVSPPRDADDSNTPLLSPVHVAELHDISEEGSDMTRDIHVALFQTKDRPATRSMPDVSEVLYEDIGKASDMAQPGGFRRGHVLASRGFDDSTSRSSGDSAPTYAHASFLDTFAPVRAGRNALKNSYDDFIIATLGLGMSREDFYDQDDDDDANTPLVRHHVGLHGAKRPQVYKSFTETDDSDDAAHGASVRKTVFTVLKSFIGSGILFLPKAFQNGGMLFSVVGLFISAALSTFCMLRLTACSDAVQRATGASSVSYGLLGERAFGGWGRLAVNVSLVLSQLGFCCSYLIFVEKNVGDIVMQLLHIHDASALASFSWTLILLQIPLYTPLTWVRRIEYFALTNLVADVLILFGIVYIIGYSVEKLESTAPQDASTWENFNSKSWALFLGTAVYCFEGIGLVLPIYDAMDPTIKHKFPKLIALTVLFLVVLFSLFAGVVYAAFGQATQSVVTLNLPNASVSGATMTVQLTYSLALVLTYPLMLYPVVKILENYVFAHRRVKGYWRWQKNAFRFALVCLTAAIAFFGKNQVRVSYTGGHSCVDSTHLTDCFLVDVFRSWTTLSRSSVASAPCRLRSSTRVSSTRSTYSLALITTSGRLVDCSHRLTLAIYCSVVRLVKSGHALNACVIVIGALTMLFATYQAIATWD